MWEVPKPGTAPEYNARAVLKGHDAIVVVVIVPDDDTVVSGSCDRTIRVWSQEHASVLRVMRGHAANVTSLAMAADNVVLATIASSTLSSVLHFALGRVSSVAAFKTSFKVFACPSHDEKGADRLCRTLTPKPTC